MKRISKIFVLTATVFASLAVTFAKSPNAHIPRDGDILHPGFAASGSLILSVIDSAKTVHIDPEAVSFDSHADATPYIDGDTISYVQFATKYRFLLRGDTLSYLGYENRATDFRLDRPLNVSFLPLRDGCEVREKWSGRLLHHGSMLLRQVSGRSVSRTRNGWTLTDGTDTLRNVGCMEWTLDMAYADPDSVSPTMPDSVASQMISEMQVDVKAMLTERLLTERTIWFSEGTRYPVLTDSRVSRILLKNEEASADTVPLNSLAMHYPADFQSSDTGEEITVQKLNEDIQENRYGKYGYAISGPNVVLGDPEVRGNIINLTLSSHFGSIEANITLYSDTGLRLSEPMPVSLTPISGTYTVKVPDGWSGVILMRVDAGDESFTVKTII